jgi:N6-L-threonylcarbamoyladenine synthase
MLVLGIETSCDETSASVVRDGRVILSNIISSSQDFHKKHGGIIPEIASRKQLEIIDYAAQEALRKAGAGLKNIDLMAVTNGPGLLGSLLVGVCFAKGLSLGSGIPLLGVDHLRSHIYAPFLRPQKSSVPEDFKPFVGLVVSGGHTSLFYARDFDQMELLGATLDDACGEAFDKVAKILGLSYPGGPVIEKMAGSGKPSIKFKCSETRRPLDFSFSGIKTAVLYYVQRSSKGVLRPEQRRRLTRAETRDICASFQEAAFDVIVAKSILACKLKKSGRLLIGGGVAANDRLREKLSAAAHDAGIELYCPDKVLCTDNAAMVAGLGARLFKKGRLSDLYLTTALN